MVGPKHIYTSLKKWSEAYGSFYKPSRYLEERVTQGKPLVRAPILSLHLFNVILVFKYHLQFQLQEIDLLCASLLLSICSSLQTFVCPAERTYIDIPSFKVTPVGENTGNDSVQPCGIWDNKVCCWLLMESQMQLTIYVFNNQYVRLVIKHYCKLVSGGMAWHRWKIERSTRLFKLEL